MSKATDWGYVARIIAIVIIVAILLLFVAPWAYREIKGPQIVMTDFEIDEETNALCIGGRDITISFTLHNTGASGTATVEFAEDNKVIGTNAYFVPADQSKRVSETFRTDCEEHTYTARIIRIAG